MLFNIIKYYNKKKYNVLNFFYNNGIVNNSTYRL